MTAIARRRIPARPAATPQEVADRLGLRLDDALIMQGVDTRLLLAALAGTVDLVELARQELAARGLGRKGEWIGFEQSAVEWGLRASM